MARHKDAPSCVGKSCSTKALLNKSARVRETTPHIISLQIQSVVQVENDTADRYFHEAPLASAFAS